MSGERSGAAKERLDGPPHDDARSSSDSSTQTGEMSGNVNTSACTLLVCGRDLCGERR